MAFQERPGQRRQVHSVRTVGLQQTPKLLWRDPAVVWPLALCLIGDAGTTVLQCDLSHVRLVPAKLRQRSAPPGETRPEEVGLGPGLSELPQEHSCALAKDILERGCAMLL